MQGDSRNLLQALDAFVGSVAGLPGRKALLYLSGDLRLDDGDVRMKRLAARANASQVTLYGLAALPLPTVATDPQGRVAQRLTAQRDGLRQMLYQLSAPTGGLGTVDLTNPETLLGRIHDDFGTYYSLGFSPPSPHDGKTHRLSVRLPAKRGLEVRAPASYTGRSREELLAERSLAALDLGIADNPLDVRLAVDKEGPMAGEKGEKADGRRAVALRVDLPFERLTLIAAPGGNHEARLSLLVAARDAKGYHLPVRHASATIKVPDARLPVPAGQRAGSRTVVPLPPGAARIAVTLRDELGGGESTAVGDFTIGAGAPAAEAPSQPPPAHQ